jgi:membrane protein implicated in regulation of membrane protease activity
VLDFLTALGAFSTLNCVYFLMLLAGIIWAALVLIGGAVAGADLPDLDLDVSSLDLPGDVDLSGIDFHVDQAVSFDHGSVEVSPLSPITIASFVTSFGGLGLISTQLLGIPEPLSLVVAGAGAGLIAGGMFLLYSRVLIAGQGSSEILLGQFRGKQAEVITPIPEQGLGQIAVISRGTRSTWAARSLGGEPIPRGSIVTIQAVTGNTVIVSHQ